MRKWIAAHRKMVALVVLAAAWGAGIALFVSWGHPLEQTIFNSTLWAVFVAVSWYVDTRRQRKTASRLDSQGGILVYVRYPDSRPGSLSGIWNMGVATFDETAALKFQPAVYDTLEPSGRPATFGVLGAESSEPRKISRKESRYVTQAGFQAIRLTTDKGDIDVAGRPESLRKILDVVTGSAEPK
ncbi:hypothetical protein [Arthrobacter sp. UYEF20]|uniref:hypothetical protein n=1 Tax=Arthrobacter sp. UYEF20 TaxID=1756363 RepID=UPI003393193A